jgi:hypothetical protein
MSDSEKLELIKKIINEILDDRTGKFDWYKTFVGKKILEIYDILK